jgi:spore germination cell wall hydrolase CwlJ-like protein
VIKELMLSFLSIAAEPSFADDVTIPQMEKIPVRHRCQFSWYCDGKSDKIYDTETWNHIYLLTKGIVSDTLQILDITEGATHYHADYVSPAWAKTKTKTIEIEDHIFYRWERVE